MAVMTQMKLTIRAKNKRNSIVVLDEIEWGVLPVGTLRHLFPFGDELEIEPDEVALLKKELEKNAWSMLVGYLAKAEHSALQSRRYLQRHSFHKSIIEPCIELCIQKKYIDDRRFAQIYVQNYLQKGKSRCYVVQKLYEFGIGSDVTEELVTELSDGELSASLLKEQIVRLLHKHRHEEPYKRKEKTFSSLYRKGFSMDEIAPVWHELVRGDDDV